MAWYIPDKKILFLHVSKAGGTSVTHWLKDNLNAFTFGPKHCRVQRAIDKNLDFDLHFCTVRNPFARVHSWYYYHKGLYEKFGPTKLLAKWQEPSEKGFEWWVVNSEKKGTTKNSIWWSQKSFLNVNRPYYYCKLENINHDFYFIQKLANCFEPLPIKNKSHHLSYKDEYTEEMKNIIQNFFADDLEYFNYDF